MATYYQYPKSLTQPQSAGQHYLLIDSYESKNAITTGNQISSIALYIPPNSLQYSHGANYEGLDNAALIGAAGAKARELFEAGGGVKNIVAAVTGGAKTQEAQAAGITTVAQKAIAIAAGRKDCIAFVSPFKGNQVGSGGAALTEAQQKLNTFLRQLLIMIHILVMKMMQYIITKCMTYFMLITLTD